MTADPSYGVNFLKTLLEPHGLDDQWCYLAEDGTAYGMARDRLAQLCRDCDIYFNLSNINWIPELELCRRRVLVDTDPVFTQIRAFGMGGAFSRYHALFTYGENVHQPECEMPTGGARWLPTRQPVVMDLWPVETSDPSRPFSTVMNWSGYGDKKKEGKIYGQKDREFQPFITLPRETGEAMKIAVNGPATVRAQLVEGGWELADPLKATLDPSTYQEYIRNSLAEFSVAKHGYVSTRCGWFSDRSTAYLAMGRPVVLQDTGFSDLLPCGRGLMAYSTREQAVAAIRRLKYDYEGNCLAARALAEEFFVSDRVLSNLLNHSL
jgi:hypothetical protein